LQLAELGVVSELIASAVGRELPSFVWAIGVKAEAAAEQKMAA